MADQLIDTPEALDAAIEATRQARRETLSRVARGKGIGLAEVLSGLVAAIALIEIFVEPSRAGFPITIACLSIASVYFSRTARRRKAIVALRDLDSGK
jgi:hypothetical protein